MTQPTHRIGALRVPPMALGTMYFGTSVDQDAAFANLDVAADLGATFWDTANNYAFWAGGVGGESETVLGQWFSSRGPQARDRIVVATKVGALPLPGHADLDHIAGLSETAIREQVVDSLRRLDTDRIDLLYAHIDDRSVPLEETVGAFNALIDDGLVREIAASNLTADRLRDALSVSCPHRYVGLQQRFTYLPPDPDADTAPQVVLDDDTAALAQESDVTLLGYSPLLSGAFTRTDRELPDEYRTGDSDEQRRVLGRMATDVSLDSGQLVLAWMAQRSIPVLPIVGVSAPDQIASAWQAVTTPVPESTLVTLDAARSRPQHTTSTKGD